MRSAFSYYGGKSKLATKIIPFIPNHNAYIEPFCGAASVLFAKEIINNNNYVEVINDKNGYLINFFRVLRNNKNDLIDKLKLTLYSRDEYYLAKEIWKNQDKYSDLDRAWSFFTHIEQSFASKLNAGWGISRNTSQSCAWNNKINNLDKIIERIKTIHIENLDAIECINKWDTEGGFLYLDPPYIDTDCGHYSDYTHAQYKELIYILKHCKSSFILSSYDNEYLPAKWKKEYFDHKCLTNNVNFQERERERIELICIVDRSKNIKNLKIKNYSQKFGEIIRGEK